jgi:chitinase
MRRSSVLAAAILAVAVQGCGDDSPSDIPAVLAVSPLEVALTPESGGRFGLTAVPAGGSVQWEVTAKPSWAELSRSSGTATGSISYVDVTAPGLATSEPGIYTGTVEILSNGGIGMVALTATVEAAPLAEVTPSSLTFGGDDDQQTFTLRNAGRGPLTWTLSSAAGHLTFSSGSGTLATGASTSITATADRTGLPVGTVEDTVVVATNAAGAATRVPAAITVAPEPLAQVSGGVIVYPPGDTASFVLSNPGTASLNWTASAGSGVTLSPASGVVAIEDSVRITVTVDRNVVTTYGVVDSVRIGSDADVSPVVPLELSRWTRPSVLDHRVVDAEYSRATDRIVTVSASPARLSIIDPATLSVQHVDLGLPPTAVSIAPDGQSAAVGHDGNVSYVDLAGASVVAVHPVTTDAIDVVLAGNGYVYVFPRTDQWESIRAIELATGTETDSGGWSIYAGTVARLHPSGDHMYGADRGLSPSDFEKYDIQSGTPSVLYDSPYHGDYSFGGDIWISDDGARLFARSGNVFRSSTVQADDMLYAGSLEGIDYAYWVEHSTAAGRILAIEGDWRGTTLAGEVRVFDTAFLNPLGVVAFPAIEAGGGAWGADGHFVFAQADGQRFHVLVKADPASGMAMDWALVSVQTDALP